MAMGHKDDEQDELFVTHAGLRKGGGHPFYEALGKLLKAENFDKFVEGNRLPRRSEREQRRSRGLGIEKRTEELEDPIRRPAAP